MGIKYSGPGNHRLYIAVILWLGKRAGKKTKGIGDFYLAGRSLGKFYQFFLNFGCSTNADQAVAVSREIYRQGIGGMWIQYLVLFLTPFYWYTTYFFRRVRLTTIGDFFTERFNSKSLGASYAVFILLMSLLGGGIGYMIAAKTMMAMTPKPLSKKHLDRFFAKMHTPVQKNQNEEKKALEEAYKNPDKYRHQKLFPKSQWEILKPTKMDALGFGGSWILVGIIIVLLWLMTSIS